MTHPAGRALGILSGVAIAAMTLHLLRDARRSTSPPSIPVQDSVSEATLTLGTPQLRVFATIGDSASRIEGLAEHDGKLYVADWKDGGVYSVEVAGGRVARLGRLPTKPNEPLLGIAVDTAGSVYVAAPQTGLIYRIDAARLGKADFKPRRDVDAFASGVKGANGLAFDTAGHLWISGGDENRVYHVGPRGGTAKVFARGYALASKDTTMPVRAFVTNGLGIDSSGHIYTANTGTGEITRLEVKPGYQLGAITPIARDERLLGADGILLSANGDLWVTANFRNTFAHISRGGTVTIIAHDSTASVLHFPAELKRVGNTFYVANLNFRLGANSRTKYKGAQIVAIEMSPAR